ncbi:hypothetical protein A7979_08575 [Rothia nasimurium]|uniref:PH domain-containing protein n=1 Tax=Rothia nasimurium TaxID=85336 RepID=A0A1Y1RSH6_9MICC|nr:hypothetical protein [Rothia nasimurium]ORC25064.1 hypothetical protein A7979_08575 [Rothia nasimurium]
MAEHAHQVPEKYGDVTKIYHPRINSYHRRLIAGLPSGVLAVACIWFMLAKRPTPLFMILLGLIALGALCAIYSTLRPHLVVRTHTHILRGRLFGWEAVELSSIVHTVFAERLTPRQAAGKQLTGVAALRYKGVPALWALNAQGKRVFRLDGRIWDAKTLRTIATAIAPQTTVYPTINVTQMNKQHPGLVTFNELHPGWKSTTVGLISLAFLLALAVAAFLPDETLQQFNIL